MMQKSHVSSLYKTKHCRKYTQNGYCPYGQRCQFIHGKPAPKPKKSCLESAIKITSQPRV